MSLSTTLFEATMIFCWGVSWPVAVVKTFKTKSVEGLSVMFLWFVFAGYVAGILFKLSEWSAVGSLNPVIGLYLFNFFWVGSEVVLYYKYRK